MRAQAVGSLILGVALFAAPLASQQIEGLDERLERLRLDEENLSDRAAELARLISEREKSETPLEERQDYVVELIRLHQELGERRAEVGALERYFEPPVFKLTRIDGERRFGSLYRHSDEDGDYVLSVVTAGLPRELSADQAFSVRFDARQRRSAPLEATHRAAEASLGDLQLTVRVGDVEVQVSRPEADCSTESRLDFWGSVWVDLKFSPERWTLEDDEMRYHYRVDVRSNGVVEQSSAASSTALMRWRPWIGSDRRGFYDVEAAVGRPPGLSVFDDRRYLSFHEGVEVSFPGQFLIYAPVAVGETHESGMTTPRHPSELEVRPDLCRQEGVRYTMVPRVEDLVQSDAVARLREVGLGETIVDAGPAPTPRDRRRVARQDPPAGARVESGHRIALHVFGEADSALSVPDVVDLTYEQARSFLDARGFEASRAEAGAPGAARDADRVIRQDPVAGSHQPRGATVTLLAYSGFEADDGGVGGGMVPVGDVTTIGEDPGGRSDPSGFTPSARTEPSRRADPSRASPIPEWIRKATEAYDRCQFDLAKLYADRIAELEPAHPWVRANRGRIETQLRNQRQTLRTMQLAQSLLQQGRAKEAVEMLRSASETSPSCMTQVVSSVYGEAETQLRPGAPESRVDPQVVQDILDSIIRIRDELLPTSDREPASDGVCPPGQLAISDREYWQIGQAEIRCIPGPNCPTGYYLYNNQTCVLDE